MDLNIKARPTKPKIRPVETKEPGCRGCDLHGAHRLCYGAGPGTPCVMPGKPYLHFKIVGEHTSTR